MCKILTVIVTFLWVLTNSTFLGRDSLPLVLITMIRDTHFTGYIYYSIVEYISYSIVHVQDFEQYNQ